MTDTFTLNTIYDSRQSFYGKARVRKDGTTFYLISYSTTVAVAKIDAHGNYVVVDPDTDLEIDMKHPGWSQTTNRHIREFYKQVKNGYIR